jgi:hypothetical protein
MTEEVFQQNDSEACRLFNERALASNKPHLVIALTREQAAAALSAPMTAEVLTPPTSPTRLRRPSTETAVPGGGHAVVAPVPARSASLQSPMGTTRPRPAVVAAEESTPRTRARRDRRRLLNATRTQASRDNGEPPAMPPVASSRAMGDRTLTVGSPESTPTPVRTSPRLHGEQPARTPVAPTIAQNGQAETVEQPASTPTAVRISPRTQANTEFAQQKANNLLSESTLRPVRLNIVIILTRLATKLIRSLLQERGGS